MYTNEQKVMVENQLKARGISDKRILKAFEEVPRHRFVPDESKSLAYSDLALPIGEGQTISQPYIVALMLFHLKPESTDKVLEIGSGSGYVSALLSKLVSRVYGVELNENLVNKSKTLLKELKFNNVKIIKGDGSLGSVHYQPFDKILISAAIPKIPESIFHQLNNNGILVAPVGTRLHQKLTVFKKQSGKVSSEEFDSCMFVPMRGKAGFY